MHPMAEPYLEKLTHLIIDLELPAAEGVALECKHFFSGAALYANGKICASLTPAGFGLKLPGEIRDRLIEAGDGTELRYFDSAPIKKDYVALSQAVLEDRKQLRALVRRSIHHAVGPERAA